MSILSATHASDTVVLLVPTPPPLYFIRTSPWANERGWRLLPVIVKADDDLRQEQLASQLLFTMRRIFRAEGVRVWLRPYDITALSADAGVIEAVADTISLDALRKYRRRRDHRKEGGNGGDGVRGAEGVGDSASWGFR